MTTTVGSSAIATKWRRCRCSMVPRPALIGSAHCAGRQRDKLVWRTFNAMPSSSEVTTMPLVQCQANAGQQILLNDGLAEKANRSGGQCPPIVTRKSRDHDNRDAGARYAQVVLKLEPGHSGQLHVRNQARSVVQPLGLQKLFSRRKCLGGETRRLHKPLYRLAN